MVNESRIPEAILEKPEHVTDVELERLIMRELFKNLFESNNLFKSPKLVDIEYFSNVFVDGFNFKIKRLHGNKVSK